jgi:hypothetical protein
MKMFISTISWKPLEYLRTNYIYTYTIFIESQMYLENKSEQKLRNFLSIYLMWFGFNVYELQSYL